MIPRHLVVALALLLAVTFVPAPSPATTSMTVRVGILREQPRVVVMSDRPIEVRAPGGLTTVLPPGAHEIAPGASGILLGDAGEVSGPLRLASSGGARLFVAIRPYRGLIELRRTAAGGLTVINELDLEEYLYGVLKLEVDPRWPAEALKAQAVAARTLAVYSLGRFRAEGYDVRATTDSQAYGGISAEDPRATAAVDATRGEILTFQGRPIFAAYHSDSGGHTESSEHVWGGRYPYLVGVPDPLTASASWTVRIDLPGLADRLRRAGKTVGGITAVEISELTPSGRAGAVRIVSSSGTITLRATELRTILGVGVLKSTMFTVRPVGGDPPVLEFSGRGSGHGVGLSQWGARGQAMQGRSYADILHSYYSGVMIETR